MPPVTPAASEACVKTMKAGLQPPAPRIAAHDARPPPPRRMQVDASRGCRLHGPGEEES